MIQSPKLFMCLALTALATQATPVIDGQESSPVAQTSTQNPGVVQTTGSTKPPNPTATKYEYPKMVSRDGVQVSADLDELVRMKGAGVDAGVIKAYVETSNTIHPPTADEILYLHSHGIPAEVVTALISRSNELRMQAAQANQYAQRPAPSVVASATPPPTYQYQYPAQAADTTYAYSYPAYGYSSYPTYSFAFGVPYPWFYFGGYGHYGFRNSYYAGHYGGGFYGAAHYGGGNYGGGHYGGGNYGGGHYAGGHNGGGNYGGGHYGGGHFGGGGFGHHR